MKILMVCLIFLSTLSTEKVFANFQRIDFESALQLAQAHPKNSFFQYVLGKHFEKQGLFKEALAQYKLCQNLNPKPYYQSALLRVSNRLTLGSALTNLASDQTQRKHFVSRTPSPKEKEANRLFKQKNYTKAAKLYKELLISSPSEYPFLQLSRCYLYNQQPLQAKKALALGKNFIKHAPSAQELQGDIALQLGNLTNALSFYIQANQLQKKSRLYRKIAKVERLQKDFSQSLLNIRKAIHLSPSSLWNYYEYAKIEEAQKHWKTALKYYRQAQLKIKRTKDSDFAHKLIESRVATCLFQESLELYNKGDAVSASETLDQILNSDSLKPEFVEKVKYWKKQSKFRASVQKFFGKKKNKKAIEIAKQD